MLVFNEIYSEKKKIDILLALESVHVRYTEFNKK